MNRGGKTIMHLNVSLRVCSFSSFLPVSPQPELSSSVHRHPDSPGWGWPRNTPGTRGSFCCPRSLNTLHRWPTEGQSRLQLIVQKKFSTCPPEFPSFLHPIKPCQICSLVPSVLTAPQDLQWCLRLVKWKLSLQPLHVCFSFSFFRELFWKIIKQTQHICQVFSFCSLSAPLHKKNNVSLVSFSPPSINTATHPHTLCFSKTQL